MNNSKYVCFDCRSTYNRDHRQCPTCQGDVQHIGKFFKAPKRNNAKAWEAVQILFDAGLRYNSSSGKYRGTIFEDYHKHKAQYTKYELLRVIERATWHYMCYVNKWIGGERPRHPREAREFLQQIENRKAHMLVITHEIANRLGRDHPDVKKCLARLDDTRSDQ